MRAKSKEESVRLSVRVPLNIMNKIKQMSEFNLRSLNSEVVAALGLYLSFFERVKGKGEEHDFLGSIGDEYLTLGEKKPAHNVEKKINDHLDYAHNVEKKIDDYLDCILSSHDEKK